MTERAQWPDGLTGRAAAARLAADGPNLAASARRRSWWHTLLGIVRDPMFLLLLGAGAIYLALGDRREAAALLGFVAIIIVAAALQQRRTERALEALRELSSPHALAVRDGRPVRIPGQQVVAGDMVLLDEGSRVVADGLLVQAHNLAIDESLLTGESLPVVKRASGGEAGEPAAMAYAGTLVTAGQGWLRVTATGGRTAFGRIGRALETLERAPSPLQTELLRLTRRLAWGAGALSLLIAVVAHLRGTGALNAVLAGIALAMAILPHELPVIMTVFLALGARRMARAGVLTRHLQAIETLGRVTALCVDKTGTLTENRMAVAALQAGELRLDLAGPAPPDALPEAFHLLVEHAVLASARVPTDPMERAFHHLAERYLAGTEHLHPDWALVREYELTPALRAMSHGWERDDAAPNHPVAAKGAPEAIAALCHLPPAEAAQLMRQADAMAAQGLRVLAVACAERDGHDWPDDQHDFAFRLLGLIGLADPIRPEVPAAVAQCREAGIEVYMITGDHPVTARAIAAQAGIDGGGVLTGAEIDGLGEAALAQRLAATRVFARLDPQQKLRLVEALLARGEIVAMTGDGVNDAPALKAAHIGIAMGRRGTDVAREAATLVAVEDDFGAIVGAVAHGRRIYDNLARAVVYALAVHLPTIALAFVPALLGLPAVLLPLHIAFLELVIGPACSIAFESEPGDAQAMRRPPRVRSERLLSPRAWRLALGAGAGGALFTLASLAANLALGADTEAARAAGFTAIVFANLGLILGVRSAGRGTPALAAVVGATLAALALVHAVPPLRAAFGFAPLSASQAAIAALPLLLTWLTAAWLGRNDRGRIR